MKLYAVDSRELHMHSPKIHTFNLKAEGMLLPKPGTLIFRTYQEAVDAIDHAHYLIALEAEKEGYGISIKTKEVNKDDEA